MARGRRAGRGTPGQGRGAAPVACQAPATASSARFGAITSSAKHKAGAQSDEDAAAEQPFVPWAERAHPGQLEPTSDHFTWLLLAGRGFGKTHAGAEWVADKVRSSPEKLRIALVGATLHEARMVMVEGYSGLLAVAPDIIDKFHSSLGEVRFKNGSIAKLFSGADPERLRGFQHHFAWCDELAKWRKGKDTWDNLQFGLRLGHDPTVLAHTTPPARP